MSDYHGHVTLEDGTHVPLTQDGGADGQTSGERVAWTGYWHL